MENHRRGRRSRRHLWRNSFAAALVIVTGFAFAQETEPETAGEEGAPTAETDRDSSRPTPETARDSTATEPETARDSTPTEPETARDSSPLEPETARDSSPVTPETSAGEPPEPELTTPGEEKPPLGAVRTMAQLERAADEGCWAKLYEEPLYEGNDFTLLGAASVPELEGNFRSIEVGPAAVVTLHKQRNFEHLIARLDAGRKVPDLYEIDNGDELTSLRITCVPRPRG